MTDGYSTIERGRGLRYYRPADVHEGYFLCRGLVPVGAVFSLTVFASNLKRAITIIGVPRLIAALPEIRGRFSAYRHAAGCTRRPDDASPKQLLAIRASGEGRKPNPSPRPAPRSSFHTVSR